jgi:hypothetical protein
MVRLAEPKQRAGLLPEEETLVVISQAVTISLYASYITR